MNRMFTPLGKHPIVNPDLLLETSQEGKYLCCLSERDVFIIRSCVFPYENWPTRYARPKKGSRWELSTEEEFISFQEDLDGLDSRIIGGDFMTCLEQGLSEIAQALRYMADHNCCNDTNISIDGGVVATYTDPNGVETAIYGTHPPATNDGETPPGGFDTWEDYLLNKCQMANLVFDGWITTLSGLSALTIFNATVLGGLIGLAFAGAIAFPPAAIPIMIAALIALGVEVAVLRSIATELNSHKADIVCQLYLSDTVESMVAILADAVDAAIATLNLAGPIGSAAKTIAMLLVNSDTLSQLISGVAGLSYPDADCSSCEGCHTIWLLPADGPRGAMVVVAQTDTSIEAYGPKYSDRDRYDWAVVVNGEGFGLPCGVAVTVTAFEASSGSVGSSEGANPSITTYDAAGGLIYSSTTTFPDVPFDAAGFQVISGTPVTIYLEWEWND